MSSRPLKLAGIIAGATAAVFACGAASSSLPTMADFWDGAATFEADAQLTRADALAQTGNAWMGGARIVPVNGAWYLIHTRYEQTDRCAVQGGLQGTVWSRKSTDKGQTWGAPVRLVDPGDFCAVVDGDLFWDGAKWRLLVQCLSEAGSWDGCYYEGSSLEGAFSAPASNPVIRDSENLLWKTLKPGVRMAGTFDVVEKSGSDFYVTYHGFNPATGEGSRGLARTRDFRSWTPLKVLLRPSDSWLPVSAGFGAASIVKAGGYYYMAAESVEETLVFNWSQRWEYGLFRASSLSGPWTAWPEQPFIDDAASAWPAYAHMFIDGGETYRAFYKITGNDATEGVYIEKLTAIAPDVCEIKVRVNGVEQGDWRTVDCEALP